LFLLEQIKGIIITGAVVLPAPSDVSLCSGLPWFRSGSSFAALWRTF
jgi:hypothetical protein